MTALSICTTIQAQLAAKRDVISLSPAAAEETLRLLNNLVEFALHEGGFGRDLGVAAKPALKNFTTYPLPEPADRGVPVEEEPEAADQFVAAMTEPEPGPPLTREQLLAYTKDETLDPEIRTGAMRVLKMMVPAEPAPSSSLLPKVEMP